MSIQYKDNTFSENQDFESIVKRFHDELNRIDNPPKSLHIGTPEELDTLKAEKTVEERLDFLEEGLEELKPEKTSSIFKPSKEQIEHVMNTLTNHK
jgi:hypothetical protein